MEYCIAPVGREVKGGCRDVTGIFKAVGKTSGNDLLDEALTPGVVVVDDHPLLMRFSPGGEHLGKKTLLCLVVGFYRPVIVEVVLREVGENPEVECAVVHPSKIDGMRGDLGDAMGHPVIGHLSENPLHFEGFRSGVGCGETVSAKAVIDRTQDADVMSRRSKDGFEQVSHGGLAVGSHDGDKTQCCGGISEKVFSEDAETAPRVPHPDGGHPGGGEKLPFMDDESGASGQGIGNECMAILLKAGNCHKETALSALTGIVANRRNFAVRISGET